MLTQSRGNSISTFLNFEVKKAYTIKVKATDSQGLMLQFDVIHLVDESDAPTFVSLKIPVVSPGIYLKTHQ